MVRVHLEVQALPWEGEDNGKVSRGSHKAQESFLVPLGERCSSEKGKGKSARSEGAHGPQIHAEPLGREGQQSQAA